MNEVYCKNCYHFQFSKIIKHNRCVNEKTEYFGIKTNEYGICRLWINRDFLKDFNMEVCPDRRRSDSRGEKARENRV